MSKDLTKEGFERLQAEDNCFWWVILIVILFALII